MLLDHDIVIVRTYQVFFEVLVNHVFFPAEDSMRVTRSVLHKQDVGYNQSPPARRTFQMHQDPLCTVSTQH